MCRAGERTLHTFGMYLVLISSRSGTSSTQDEHVHSRAEPPVTLTAKSQLCDGCHTQDLISQSQAWGPCCAYFRRVTTVEPNRASHSMEMPSSMGLAKSALKLISPAEFDLYTPFRAGRTVACAPRQCQAQTVKQRSYTCSYTALLEHDRVINRCYPTKVLNYWLNCGSCQCSATQLGVHLHKLNFRPAGAQPMFL